jgi:hypothetical protein
VWPRKRHHSTSFSPVRGTVNCFPKKVNWPPKSVLYRRRNPCERQAIGLLQRRHVKIDLVKCIGKESNSLESVDGGMVHSEQNAYTDYADPRRTEWIVKIQPALKKPKLEVLIDACGKRLCRREIIELRRAERSRIARLSTCSNRFSSDSASCRASIRTWLVSGQTGQYPSYRFRDYTVPNRCEGCSSNRRTIDGGAQATTSRPYRAPSGNVGHVELAYAPVGLDPRTQNRQVHAKDSDDPLQVEHGSQYPALHRLEQQNSRPS